MNNSPDEHGFYIESDEDEDEKELHEGGGGGYDDKKDLLKSQEDEGNDSDFSDSSAENQHHDRPGSYNNTSWPQSYRQSIDLYSSVPSPNLGFLGTPNSLSRLGSSFLSSSLTRRHTPDSLLPLTKPLLSPVEDEQRQQLPPPPHRHSSHLLPPPIPPSRRSSIRKDEKPSIKVSHELPISPHSSFAQTVANGINVLCGVGILSTPYAVQQGGWLGLVILFVFSALSYYTGVLLARCLDSEPGLETYPDIGQAAFGTAGRIAISIILYVELYACCIEYIILESDNLSSLFPSAHLDIGGFLIDSRLLFALITTLAVLPTVWLRDLTVLSYISAGGVVASVMVVLCLFWVGTVDGIGFVNKGTALNLGTLPVAIGLYGYCYSGHAVFPNIYSSMANRNQYPLVLFTCFGICTLMYAGVAVMGYKMFGDATLSQFTLNMPNDLVATKIAVWTTVVNPFTKYALTITPVAMSLEELIPSSQSKSHHIYSILIRTGLVISTLIVALSIPFFGLVMSLIGSFLTMLVTLILPCACYLSILRGRITRLQGTLCIIVITVGVVSSSFGTYSALSKIIENLSG
ncbi:amino acid transporter AVT1C-like [Humulus lupulus]|uniref:amino acid transporter AVT1C-like n=1 Tax=Humulus lupulus TaxID=3486 RepID=UPI002B405C0F|nr:amino acid transporter AVT1C-like [Humulus lupulus]XP_062093004.1 amino acid transporter AVT1C-like [Humulus lupulus]